MSCHSDSTRSSNGRGADTGGGTIKAGPGVTLRHRYSSYNDFITYVRGNPIKITPVKLSDSLVQSSGSDTTNNYFQFESSRFKYTSIFLRHDTEENEAGDSLYTWNFTIDDDKLMARSVPDSVRGNDFSSGKLPDLNLELDKAGKFKLDNITYLIIPSETSSCEGGFCQTELDHIFKLKSDSLPVYFTVDGWQLCNLNNDNKIEQIIFSYDSVLQRHHLDKLKKARGEGVSNIDASKCLTIQIWIQKKFTNEQWEPMIDKNNKPYFIFLAFDRAATPNTYEVLDYNWVRPL